MSNLTVPGFIVRLKSLTLLQISGKQITKLPEFLADTPGLETIKLGKTGIKKFPKSLERFMDTPW
jgi:Leucine-rich repeat (LRR) protein